MVERYEFLKHEVLQHKEVLQSMGCCKVGGASKYEVLQHKEIL